MNYDGDDNTLGPGILTILSMTKTIPARARFVGEAVLSGTLSSLTMGLACGATSAVLFPWSVGPLVPYLAGSAVGYSFGLFQHWSTSKRYALYCARHYPALLAHALFIEREMVVPASVQKPIPRIPSGPNQTSTESQRIQALSSSKAPPQTTSTSTKTISKNDNSSDDPKTMDQWIRTGGLGRLTWSILASQRCRPAVEAFQRHEQQRLVDRIVDEI